MIYSRLSTLAGKSHGRRSLVGYSPWSCEESDTTEWLHFHVSLSCIGEGNGNSLQCSCLENPRDGGACWAAVCGVRQSWTRLMRLSSSSRKKNKNLAILLCPLHGSQPYCGEGAWIIQWSYEPCHAGLSKRDELMWRVLPNCGPPEERMANHSSILAVKTPWTVWKGKKIRCQKMSPQGW